MNTLITDLHIHSRFARACSKHITLHKLEEGARLKGLHLIGTGDFTHPHWHKEITSTLTEDENGILWSPTRFPFLWQTEISLIYTHKKGRRVHYLLLAPNGDVVKQIIDALGKKGRLDYDGRPIFGFTSIELVDMMRSISHEIEIIPAHAWTSWFSVFGSKSGYDSLQECFEDNTKYIHAIETGMSSDPAMNRRVSALDNIQLVSFSDMHSFHPWRIGREATLFTTPLTYKNILHAIRTGEGLTGTIETPPEYGKYHYDGHRNCNVVLHPEESKHLNRTCPKCKQPLTIGVAYRVEELADRTQPIPTQQFYTLVPLSELIAATFGTQQLSSRKVHDTYTKLITAFKNEYTVLLETSLEDLKKVVSPHLASLIIKNRNKQLHLNPGYDGVYGELILEENANKKPAQKQATLTNY